jgi:hypothetical protein
VGGWTAISIGSVREEHLQAILDAEGTSWQSASHVAATTSLARIIRSSGSVALPIATLIDLIVLPGVKGGTALPLLGFPGPSMLTADDPKPYDAAVSAWQQAASGRRLRLGIQFDDCLRRFARTKASESTVGRVLVRSRRELSRTVLTLIAAGVHPTDLSTTDAVAQVATAAWAQLETEIPALTAVRDDLWVDFDDFEHQSSAHAQDLRTRIERALDCAFGAAVGRRVIVHHGFYFYTPPQWALFQLLRRIPNIDQIFVIHDDGSNRAFETWRRFFSEKWDMPAPRPAQESSGVTHAAAALRDALGGERIDDSVLAESVRVLECRSPSELVRKWRLEEAFAVETGALATKRFAADAKSVERFVRRLGKASGSGRVDLAQLPIGSFLLAIHDCIKPLATGGLAVTLRGDAMVDIAASGYLDFGGRTGPPSPDVGALRRALPFFRDCVSGEQWRERSLHLHRLVIDEVTRWGGRDPYLSDVDRIRTAADNPLRLVPWADLSADEAATVAEMIGSTISIVTEIASRERVALKDHMLFLRRKLQQGMQDLPAEERHEIEAKVDGFSVALEDEIDVDGLIDVVTMLLGRTAEFDVTGESESQEGSVGELRSLDALGFRRIKQDMHVANLADGTFPSRVRPVGWPFRVGDIKTDAFPIDYIVEILKARADNAALSDLYLMWLALDGVEPGHHVTLSWISELGGETHNPSSILGLLMRPSRPTEAIAERAGGLTLEIVTPVGDMAALTEWPEPADPVLPEAEINTALAKLDSRATASSQACARRFVLQWALGPSAAFQSDHHHSMLFGNVAGALVKLKFLDTSDALRVCTDLWRWLTTGERASSLAKRRVDPGKRSADGLWILTLAGSKRSTKPRSRKGTGPLDHAYQAAVAGQAPDPLVVVPLGTQYLPPGVPDVGICERCPVRPRCADGAEPHR